MALSFVGGKVVVGTGSTYSLDLTALTGGSGSAAQIGDLVVVAWGWATSGGSAATLTMSSAGYTYCFDAQYGNDNREANIRAAYKYLTAADTTCITNGPNSASNGGGAVCHVWRGADSGTQMDVAAVGTSAINGGDPDPPAISPSTAGAVIVVCGLGSQVTTGNTPLTVPSGFSNFFGSHSDGSAADSNIGMASISWDNSAPYDPPAFGGGSTASTDAATSGTIAIRPSVNVVSGDASPAMAVTFSAAGVDLPIPPYFRHSRRAFYRLGPVGLSPRKR